MATLAMPMAQAASSFWLLAVIAGAVLPSVVGGLLSDRMGRRKLFVYLSSGLIALVVSVLLVTLIQGTVLVSRIRGVR